MKLEVFLFGLAVALTALAPVTEAESRPGVGTYTPPQASTPGPSGNASDAANGQSELQPVPPPPPPPEPGNRHRTLHYKVVPNPPRWGGDGTDPGLDPWGSDLAPGAAAQAEHQACMSNCLAGGVRYDFCRASCG